MSDTSENGLSGQALGFMRQAIELSEENVRSGGGPFGAVIVRDGRVIATGTNGVTRLNDPTAHAEVTAIRNAARARCASGRSTGPGSEKCTTGMIRRTPDGSASTIRLFMKKSPFRPHNGDCVPAVFFPKRLVKPLSFGMKSPINGNIDPVGKIVLRFRNLFLPLSRIRCHGWNMTRRESCENQEQYPLL